MTAKDYNEFATIFHDVYKNHHEDWEVVYNRVYNPLCKLLEADNPRFDTLTFAFAVATGKEIKRPVPKGTVVEL